MLAVWFALQASSCSVATPIRSLSLTPRRGYQRESALLYQFRVAFESPFRQMDDKIPFVRRTCVGTTVPVSVRVSSCACLHTSAMSAEGRVTSSIRRNARLWMFAPYLSSCEVARIRVSRASLGRSLGHH